MADGPLHPDPLWGGVHADNEHEHGLGETGLDGENGEGIVVDAGEGLDAVKEVTGDVAAVGRGDLDIDGI